MTWIRARKMSSIETFSLNLCMLLLLLRTVLFSVDSQASQSNQISLLDSDARYVANWYCRNNCDQSVPRVVIDLVREYCQPIRRCSEPKTACGEKIVQYCFSVLKCCFGMCDSGVRKDDALRPSSHRGCDSYGYGFLNVPPTDYHFDDECDRSW